MAAYTNTANIKGIVLETIGWDFSYCKETLTEYPYQR